MKKPLFRGDDYSLAQKGCVAAFGLAFVGGVITLLGVLTNRFPEKENLDKISRENERQL